MKNNGIKKLLETDIETIINLNLENLGWICDPRKNDRNVYKQTVKHKKEKKKLNGLKPDYVLYVNDKPFCVIEVKRSKYENLQKALEQSIKYSEKINCKYSVATNGFVFKSWNLEKNRPWTIGGENVNDLLPYDTAFDIANKKLENVNKKVIQDHSDLINIFKKANTVLSDEGIDPGIDQLTEFSKIIFLKLYCEDDNTNFKKKWISLLQTKNKYLISEANKLLSNLAEKYKDTSIFGNLKIKNNETLKKLLDLIKNINLKKTKSKIKGAAFEYFIHSYSRGTNQLGQYFTPRHIVKFLIKLLNPEIRETIYDPFCGTGGMLVYSWEHLKLLCDKDKPEDLKFLKNNTFFGNDISTSATIAKMNMILFGDGHNNIKKINTFEEYKQNENDKFDIVVTNFPFSQDTNYNNKYPIPTSNTNGICVQHCLLSMKNHTQARCGIIVPTSFLYSDENIQDRKWIINNYQLKRVIDLNQYTFQPFTLQNTAILIIKNKDKNDKSDFFIYNFIKNDGFTSDAYRLRSDDNDLDLIFEDNNPINKKIRFSDLTDGKFRFKKLEYFFGKNFKPLKNFLKKISIGLPYSVNSLKDREKFEPKKSNFNKSYLMMKDINNKNLSQYWKEYLSINQSNWYLKKEFLDDVNDQNVFQKNAIIFGTSGQGALCNHRKIWSGENKFVVSSTVCAIQVDEKKIHPYIVFYNLLFFDIENISYDRGYPGLKKQDILNIPIKRFNYKKEKYIIKIIGNIIQQENSLNLVKEKLKNL